MDNTQAQRDRLAHLDRINNAVGSDDGLYFVCWLLEKAGFQESVFTGNSKTYWMSGRQDLGNEVFAEIISANPDIGHRVLDFFINAYRGDEAAIRSKLDGRRNDS